MIRCDVIKDLIPLYYDDVASEGSRELVDEHLKDCAGCREIWDKMKDDYKSTGLEADSGEIYAFKKIRRKILINTAVIALSAVILSFIIVGVIYTWSIPTPYNIENIHVHPANTLKEYGTNQMNIVPIIDLHDNWDHQHISTKQIDDELFISTRNAIYTRFFRNGRKGSWFPHINMLHNRLIKQMQYKIGDDINRVYYVNETKENAVLIWER